MIQADIRHAALNGRGRDCLVRGGAAKICESKHKAVSGGLLEADIDM